MGQIGELAARGEEGAELLGPEGGRKGASVPEGGLQSWELLDTEVLEPPVEEGSGSEVMAVAVGLGNLELGGMAGPWPLGEALTVVELRAHGLTALTVVELRDQGLTAVPSQLAVLRGLREVSGGAAVQDAGGY